MLSANDVMQLIQSLIWLLAGVGVFIVGMNKVCEDLEAAIHRVRYVAAPLNSKRLGAKTPCADGVTCYECGSPACPCRATLISHFPMNGMPATILLIDEALGL